MPALSVATLIVGAVGVFCLMIVLSRLSSVGGQSEQPVGPLHAARPEPPPPALVPASFRSLIGNEAAQWKRPNHWLALTAQLEDLERRLGGSPSQSEPPDEYSAEWLEARVAHIEAIAGPLPSPMTPTQQPTTKRRFWMKR